MRQLLGSLESGNQKDVSAVMKESAVSSSADERTPSSVVQKIGSHRVSGKSQWPTSKRKKRYRSRPRSGAPSADERENVKLISFQNVLILSADLLPRREAKDEKVEGKRAPNRHRGQRNKVRLRMAQCGRAHSLCLRPSTPRRARPWNDNGLSKNARSEAAAPYPTMARFKFGDGQMGTA